MAKVKIDASPKAPEAPLPVSERKAAYQNLIERYKAQNPVKYELKKAELQRKLDAIQ